jgi:hypothetical protein
MRLPTRPRSALALHLGSTIAFAALAIWLAQEWRGLAGARAWFELAAVAAALALAALTGLALLVFARGGPLSALASRARMSTYAQLIVVAGLLSLGAQRIHASGGRPAFAAFCALAAVWILAFGFGLSGRLWLGADRFIEALGRTVRFDRLEWFEIIPESSDPPRCELLAGRGVQLLLRARLAERDPAPLRKALRRAGLDDRSRC